MPQHIQDKLLSYIAHSAPATRRPGTGDEPFIRPEIGFIPNWYLQTLDIDFGKRWHTDPAYRKKTIIAMSRETRKRFGRRSDIGILQDPGNPLDVLTGTYGALLVSGIYGVPIQYKADDWPWGQTGLMTDEEADALEPPDLGENSFWDEFLSQLDWIESNTGKIVGFMNWQGVLNNSFRLRGNRIFSDLIAAPERVKHVFECVTETMIQGVQLLYERQSATGVDLSHYTISNCLVNMLSPNQYREFQLPFDMKIAKEFEMIGVHNCAWNADPYMDSYAMLPGVAYVDMGMDSDLLRARETFPEARRAIMYKPSDIKTKHEKEIRGDLKRIAREYGPCDMVFADIEDGTPDRKVHFLIDTCEEISKKQDAL